MADVQYFVECADFIDEVLGAELLPLVKCRMRLRPQAGFTRLVSQVMLNGACDLAL